jgi:hypothetical protein
MSVSLSVNNSIRGACRLRIKLSKSIVIVKSILTILLPLTNEGHEVAAIYHKSSQGLKIDGA